MRSSLSLKPSAAARRFPTAEQMDTLADLADNISFGEIRVGHDSTGVAACRAARPAGFVGVARKAGHGDAETSTWCPTSSALPGLILLAANARSIPRAQ